MNWFIIFEMCCATLFGIGGIIFVYWYLAHRKWKSYRSPYRPIKDKNAEKKTKRCLNEEKERKGSE